MSGSLVTVPPSSTPRSLARAMRWAGVMGGVLLALTACAEDETAPHGGAPEATRTSEVRAADVPSYADFLARDTALRCAQLGELCPSFGQARSYACDDVLPDDAYDAERAGVYSPEGGAACLNERVALGLAGRLAREGYGEVAAGVASACDTVFRGSAFATIALGEPCTLQSDCAPLSGGRAQCVGFDPEARFCRGALAARMGDRCNAKAATEVQVVPSEDVLCDHANQRYVPVPALGAPCVNGACGPDAACVASVCVARLANGSSCETSDVCASGRCAGATCLALGKRGESCAASADCASGQCEQGLCGRTFVYRYVCE